MVVVDSEMPVDMDPGALNVRENAVHVKHYQPGHGLRMAQGLLKACRHADGLMITLIGVGHVFAISENVKEIIRSKRPEVVCLELDAARYNALVQKDHSRAVPLQYRLLAHFPKRMAGKVRTEVGDEMMAAAGAAQEVGARGARIHLHPSP